MGEIARVLFHLADGLFVLGLLGVFIFALIRARRPYSKREEADADAASPRFLMATVWLLKAWRPVLLHIVAFIFALIRPPRYSEREEADADAASSRFFMATVSRLNAWHPDALADLSNDWEGERDRDLFGLDSEQGVVGSLRDPLASRWLAFHLSQKGSYAFLRLRTSEHEVRLDFTTDGIGIWSRGDYFGYARGRAPETYDLWDSSAQPIGTYVRALVGADYGPVVVGGRLLGEVGVMLRGRDYLFGSTPQPAMVKMDSGLTIEEVDWLLAVVGLELMHCRRRFYSD